MCRGHCSQLLTQQKNTSRQYLTDPEHLPFPRTSVGMADAQHPAHSTFSCCFQTTRPTFNVELGVLFLHFCAVVSILSAALVPSSVFLCDVTNGQCQGNGVSVNLLLREAGRHDLCGGVVPCQVIVNVSGGSAGQLNITPNNGGDRSVCLQTRFYI